jgi:hypothetical protein
MESLVHRLASRAKQRVVQATENVITPVAHWKVDHARIDPRISYPSYMPFDDFIDVEALKALDGYITERILRHSAAHADSFFHTGAMVMDKAAPKKPGSRIIYLSQSKRGFVYDDLNKAEMWDPAPAAHEFSRLMDLIETFPFKTRARMMIMYDDSGKPVTAHRDHVDTNLCHEFIWFRSNRVKPFYVMNHKTGQREDVQSYSAWFDTCNQFHGADGYPGLSFSLRVDGQFSDELRKQIPTPAYNVASTPSLWRCTTLNRMR